MCTRQCFDALKLLITIRISQHLTIWSTQLLLAIVGKTRRQQVVTKGLRGKARAIGAQLLHLFHLQQNAFDLLLNLLNAFWCANVNDGAIVEVGCANALWFLGICVTQIGCWLWVDGIVCRIRIAIAVLVIAKSHLDIGMCTNGVAVLGRSAAIVTALVNGRDRVDGEDW